MHALLATGSSRSHRPPALAAPTGPRSPARWGRLAWAATIAVLAAAGPRAAAAQLRADPGALINGRVIVTVNVTLFDLDEPYVPLTKYRLVLHGPARDSSVLQTNDAGVVSIGVPAGAYRLVSERPVVWKGRSYRWDVPVTVQRWMPVVDLNPRNAVVSGAGAVGTR